MKWIKRILFILVSIPIICVGGVIAFFILFHLLNPWSNIITLEKGYKLNALFVNDGYEAIFGYKMPIDKMMEPGFNLGKRHQYDTSFIYRRNAGNQSWHKVYNKPGKIRQISFDQSTNTIFALGTHENVAGEGISFIISSQDQGVTWSDIHIPEKKYLGFDLSCNGTKYLWTDKTVYSLTNMSDSFQPVETSLSFNMSGKSTTTDNECNLWIGYGNEIVMIGKDSKEHTELVREDINIDSINYNKSDLSVWLIGRVKGINQTLLLKRTGINNFEEIRQFPYFLPSKLLIEKETIVIPGVNTANVVSFLGLEKIFYTSKNSGIKWSRDKFFYPSFAQEPFFMYHNTVYLNSSMGDIKKKKI
ncbi:MAG: hypothetical protein KJ630_05905 [Proteobacteria bacterium]|nr:hypothetical protein [Pseudomonadota bacterium]